MYIEIITTVVGRAHDRYSVAVTADGVLRYTLGASVATVTKVRNRECAKWSSSADVVLARAIPPIPTLDPRRSRRNYGK
jgi:hypothetical protein